MTHNHSIPHLSANQSPQQVMGRFSKWLSTELLVDPLELKSCFDALNSFALVSPFNSNPTDPHVVSKELFLDSYSEYITCLKNQSPLEINTIRKSLHAMLVINFEGVFLKPITKTSYSLVFELPFIEIKPICLNLSSVDGKIHTASVSSQGILWGLQFSCPQIYQNPRSLQTEKISMQTHPIGQLFNLLRQWVRKNTRATPLLIGSKKVNLPVRLGKNCFEWINKHPQLKAFNLQVQT